MDFARITTGGQATIPARIREVLGLAEGDVIAFEIADDHVVLRKVASEADGYLQGLTAVLSEWDSPEDEAAWRGL
ncbi:MAG: AbrB/MazE/SpoVT family DNA-binding domain-containing protein [Chloroflexi bacterium]|nr:AbrB/MazE/SpoVT family DNA-binding domain-containing protein [Chloroflexota bacterium]MYD65721.1 AbrB/MazE/SpoVT family DNA-binding domain-containing protein [Chloroflexota bacterium]